MLKACFIAGFLLPLKSVKSLQRVGIAIEHENFNPLLSH